MTTTRLACQLECRAALIIKKTSSSEAGRSAGQIAWIHSRGSCPVGTLSARTTPRASSRHCGNSTLWTGRRRAEDACQCLAGGCQAINERGPALVAYAAGLACTDGDERTSTRTPPRGTWLVVDVSHLNSPFGQGIRTARVVF